MQLPSRSRSSIHPALKRRRTEQRQPHKGSAARAPVTQASNRAGSEEACCSGRELRAVEAGGEHARALFRQGGTAGPGAGSFSPRLPLLTGAGFAGAQRLIKGSRNEGGEQRQSSRERINESPQKTRGKEERVGPALSSRRGGREVPSSSEDRCALAAALRSIGQSKYANLTGHGSFGRRPDSLLPAP